MSNTPETDANEVAFAVARNESGWLASGHYVKAEFARSLERRLAKAAAKLAERDKDAERYRTIKKWYIELGEHGIDEITDLDAAIDAAKSSEGA